MGIFSKISLVFRQKRPMVMHTAKREKCQILWMGPFCGMTPHTGLENFLSSFLGLVSKVLEWTPNLWQSWKCNIRCCISQFRIKSCGMDPPPDLTSGNFWNSTFACTVQCIHANLPYTFSHQLRPIWKC